MSDDDVPNDENRLPALARDRILALLEIDTRVGMHFIGDLHALPKQQLLALATKRGIDVAGIIEDVRKNGTGLESCYEAEEIEQWKHSEKYPAFAGTVEC